MYWPQLVWLAFGGFLRWMGRTGMVALLATSVSALSNDQPISDGGDAPQVRALLMQAWASEVGRGVRKNPWLAVSLYGQAGKLGSAEGYYRAGRIHRTFDGSEENLKTAACFFSAASVLGHHQSQWELDRLEERVSLSTMSCSGNYAPLSVIAYFDLDRYVSGLSLPRQKIVGLIRTLAPLYGVDPRLALAVATVESNLDPLAVSPKQAMGVMQLIPETAERFNVRKPFDPEQNIRGGLSYLRWLHRYFAGDTSRIVAAYNAGEKAVDRYGGIPPYDETVMYVARVLAFSGRDISVLPPTGAGSRKSSK